MSFDDFKTKQPDQMYNSGLFALKMAKIAVFWVQKEHYLHLVGLLGFKFVKTNILGCFVSYYVYTQLLARFPVFQCLTSDPTIREQSGNVAY